MSQSHDRMRCRSDIDQDELSEDLSGSIPTAQHPRSRCLVLQEPRLGDALDVIRAIVARVDVELRPQAIGREVVPRGMQHSGAARTLSPFYKQRETVEVGRSAEVCDPDISAIGRRDEDVSGFEICVSALEVGR